LGEQRAPELQKEIEHGVYIWRHHSQFFDGKFARRLKEQAQRVSITITMGKHPHPIPIILA
jgi:hypothetical protein